MSGLFWESAYLWRDAVIAASIGALLLSYLGFYVVLTRSAFVSATISQMTGLGVTLALIFGASAEGAVPLVTGIALGAAGTALLALPANMSRGSRDGFLAVAFIAASALTLLLARFLAVDFRHVQAVLYGDAVVASTAEVATLGGLAALVALVHRFFRQRFLLVIFDPDAARVQGMRTRRWSLLLALTIGIAIAASAKVLGALTAFAFSVVPAVAALALFSTLRAAMIGAAVLGLLSATLGYCLAFLFDLPVGPAMVIVSLAGPALALGIGAARR